MKETPKKLVQDNNNNNNSNNNLNFDNKGSHKSETGKWINYCGEPIIENENLISSSQSVRSASGVGCTRMKLKNGREIIEVDRYGDSRSEWDSWIMIVCVFIYSLVPLGSLISGIILISLCSTSYWYVSVLYLGYLVYDRKTYATGGSRVNMVFHSIFWKYLAAYFPIKIRYSTNFKLSPKENYILNYSPHGISAFGSVCAFATDALEFNKLFPGMSTRFMVHEMAFMTPFMKEAFAYRGDCSVASRSIDYMLTPSKASTGNLLTLVAGGLQEADLSDQETLKVVVMKRKGFVKKALIHGAHLIPCIAFGENSVFNKVNLNPNSFLYQMDKLVYKILGFKHPVYYGNYLTMPYKRPITVAMADPIKVIKNSSPTQEQIDQLHDQYVSSLKDLYETHSDLRQKYDINLELH